LVHCYNNRCADGTTLNDRMEHNSACLLRHNYPDRVGREKRSSFRENDLVGAASFTNLVKGADFGLIVAESLNHRSNLAF
jgi:hypothetical protein